MTNLSTADLKEQKSNSLQDKAKFWSRIPGPFVFPEMLQISWISFLNDDLKLMNKTTTGYEVASEKGY